MNYYTLILLSFFLFLFGANISTKLKLLDYPKKRKIHNLPIPFTGGIIISIIYLFVVQITNFDEQIHNQILIYGFVIAVFGLIDDKYNLNVGSKLILQLFPIVILVFISDTKIETLNNFPVFGDVSLGSFDYIFTILCIYFLINSSNYIDGLDGILGISFLISTISLFLYINSLNFEISKFIIYLIIPVLVFLLFNFKFLKLPKIFLGDSGSFLLGYVLSFLMIVANKNYNVDLGVIIWFLSFQVYEFLSVNFARLQNGQNLFKPGQDHVHHLIFKATNSTLVTNLYLLAIQIFLISVGCLTFKFFMTEISIVLFLLLFFLYFFCRKKISYLKNLFYLRK